MKSETASVRPNRFVGLDDLERLLRANSRIYSKSHLPSVSAGRICGRMVQIKEPAQQETDKWKQIRRTERALADVQKWDVFQKTCAFAEKDLPFRVAQENMEHIEVVLTQRLVELKK